MSLNLLRCWLHVSLCSVHSAVCVCLCLSPIYVPSCQCPASIRLGAALLSSHHSHSREQLCLCSFISHQSDSSQLRHSPSVLLSLHWPKLTAGGQVRAPVGPDYSEYQNKQEIPIKNLSSLPKHSWILATTPGSLPVGPTCLFAPLLDLHVTNACMFSSLTPQHPVLQSANHSQQLLIISSAVLPVWPTHSSSGKGSWFSSKATGWRLTDSQVNLLPPPPPMSPPLSLPVIILQLILLHLCMMIQHCHLMALDGKRCASTRDDEHNIW